MMQAGVILSDYATLMVEILKDNARPEAAAGYGTRLVTYADDCAPRRREEEAVM